METLEKYPALSCCYSDGKKERFGKITSILIGPFFTVFTLFDFPLYAITLLVAMKN